MPKENIVTINGRYYDTRTGLPVKKKEVVKREIVHPQTSHAITVHTKTQRSQTLNRRVVKKKVEAPAQPAVSIATRQQPVRHMDIAPSRRITRFLPHKSPVQKASKPAPQPVAVSVDAAPVAHPVAHKALVRHQAKRPAVRAPQPVAAPTAQAIKHTAIRHALDSATPEKTAPKITRRRWPRRAIIAASILVFVATAGYVSYVNIPSISVSIAGAQAGISAVYPGYTPDSFSLSQPVAVGDGKVSLTFVSHTGVGSYTITQAKSSWNSSAVLESIVKPAVENDYFTTQEKGLTIYTYSKNKSAAWVNAGILFTIESNAPLTREQIRHVATSL